MVGPGSDGIMVIWKDNFDSLYSEVAELGRCVLCAHLQSCLRQIWTSLSKNEIIFEKNAYPVSLKGQNYIRLNRNEEFKILPALDGTAWTEHI